MKSVSLVTAAMLLGGLFLLRFLRGVRIGPFLLGVVPGLLAILVPLAIRGTALNDGHFLLIANDGGRGFLIGHHGRLGWTEFRDPIRRNQHHFLSPTAFQRGYSQELQVPHGVYETAPLYDLAWEWIRANPQEALLMSIEHVFDMFSQSYAWPGMTKEYFPWVIFFQEVFIVLLLFPAAYHATKNFHEICSLDRRFWADGLLIITVGSIYLIAFLVVGEPRYRIPYDTFMILLAARAIVFWERGNSSFRLVASSR